jgi:sirohydrochlorin ferrochelatase
MTIALVDNGSVEAAAHLNLRAVATALSRASGVLVNAISWKHSDRVPVSELGGEAARTLAPWLRAELARGEREFVFVPFFVSAQGAIGSALRSDLDKILHETAAQASARYFFSAGLHACGAIAPIVAERVRETISGLDLPRAKVVVVDHGGPSAASAALRDSLAAEIRALLGSEIAAVTPASMEGAHGPLLADVLATPEFHPGDVIVAPLFLSPGRHAGPDGDIAQICRDAETQSPGLRCHVAGLVGTHPGVVAPLALALRETLSHFHTSSLA